MVVRMAHLLPVGKQRYYYLNSVRSISTSAVAASSKMVDDLLQYVFSGTSSSGDQAVDIIKSGLGAQPDQESGIGTARYCSA